ncbi:MAG: DinB family protein, partial [Psychroserpens sp.]|nr:DinB family protein [Psychroserpens sp.]
ESFLKTIPDEQFGHAYAEGKWTIKEVVQHIIDTERVFSYRALRFARYDSTELPGYDQDDFALNSKANLRSKEDILNEYSTQRAASIAMFESFDAETLLGQGKASGSSISVRALGFILIGHENHHCQIIKDRYL